MHPLDERLRYLLFACRSHNAESRMSASLMLLFELEYMKRLHCVGWNSAAVMTSVSSSILTGLMSTMSMGLSIPDLGGHVSDDAY